MSEELITFFTAMIPFVDLKLAIPLGRELGLSSTNALLFAVAGNVVPSAILLATLEPLTNWAQKKSKFIHNLLQKTFDKTRKDHSKRFQRYGAIFIIAFVALPIPGSGSATGSILAFLFGVDRWKALSLIFAGILIAGLVISAGVESITALIRFFN